MFKQYQEIELVQDMMSDELLGEPVQLHLGQRGVIVDIHSGPGLPTGYDVEFFNEQGETIAVMIMTKEQIRPVKAAKTSSSAQDVA